MLEAGYLTLTPPRAEYLLLLYASGANLLSFADYTTESVYDAITGQKQKKLAH